MIKTRGVKFDQSGQVFVITTALLVIFFIAAAFAVDLTAASAGVNQSRFNAKLAALAALEEFFRTDCKWAENYSACYSQQLPLALSRAQSVADAGLILRQDSAAETFSSTPGAKAVLESGTYFSIDDGTHPCADGKYPCFKPSDVGVNAFRVSGNLYSAKTVFSHYVFGTATFSANVDVVASVIPRHGCFLVDLSASTIRKTHYLTPRDEDGSAAWPSEYGFFLSQDNPGATSIEGPTWDNLSLQGPRDDETPIFPSRHYQNDYELKQVLSDSNFNLSYKAHHPDPSSDRRFSASELNTNYRLDLFRGGSYAGPEPLTTIFKGLHRAIELLEERRVAGDMACLIFYDDRMEWPRIVNMTDDFDYLKEVTDPAQLTNPKEATNRNGHRYYSEGNPTASPPAIRHRLFPGQSAFTDTLRALREANVQFTTGAGAQVMSSDFIVSIGDGLANCRDCNDTGIADWNDDGFITEDDAMRIFEQCSSPEDGDLLQTPDCIVNYDIDDDGDLDWDDFSIAFYASQCQPRCLNSYYSYREAIAAINDHAVNYLHKSKVPVHVIFVGDHVTPHTKQILDKDGINCLSDVAAREQEQLFVLGGNPAGVPYPPGSTWSQDDWNRMVNLGTTFPQANADWYTIALMTGGIWGPIRPIHPACAVEGGPAVNVPCRNGERQLYDTNCRSTAAQITDYMEDIMRQNPYAIVRSN